MKETITAFSNTAVFKVNQLKFSKSRYLAMTMLAGFFVGLELSLFLRLVVCLSRKISQVRIVMGISFGIALESCNYGRGRSFYWQ